MAAGEVFSWHQLHTTKDAVRRRREEMGLTTRELADRLGLKNRTFVTLIETGESLVPLARVFDFAEVLNVPRLWFLELALKERDDTRPLHDWLFSPGGYAHADWEKLLAEPQAADSNFLPDEERW